MQKNKVGDLDVQMINELGAIKRLLTLLLIKAGTSQEEVAVALQTDRSVVSRMVPARKIKSFKFVE